VGLGIHTETAPIRADGLSITLLSVIWSTDPRKGL